MNKQRWEEHTTGFLHAHPMLQQKLGLDDKHVIVDRKDWEKYPSEIETAKQERTEEIEKMVEGMKNVTIDGCIYKSDVINSLKPYGGK